MARAHSSGMSMPLTVSQVGRFARASWSRRIIPHRSRSGEGGVGRRAGCRGRAGPATPVRTGCLPVRLPGSPDRRAAAGRGQWRHCPFARRYAVPCQRSGWCRWRSGAAGRRPTRGNAETASAGRPRAEHRADEREDRPAGQGGDGGRRRDRGPQDAGDSADCEVTEGLAVASIANAEPRRSLEAATAEYWAVSTAPMPTPARRNGTVRKTMAAVLTVRSSFRGRGPTLGGPKDQRRYLVSAST